MKRSYIFIVFYFLFSLCVSAQQAPEKSYVPSVSGIEPEEVRYFTSDVYGGKVIINQSSELEKLVGIRMAILKKQKGFKGYRIRLFANVGRGARRMGLS